MIRHILEKWTVKKKNKQKTVSFQSTKKDRVYSQI